MIYSFILVTKAAEFVQYVRVVAILPCPGLSLNGILLRVRVQP